jgi:hypothetical protein
MAGAGSTHISWFDYPDRGLRGTKAGMPETGWGTIGKQLRIHISDSAINAAPGRPYFFLLPTARNQV